MIDDAAATTMWKGLFEDHGSAGCCFLSPLSPQSMNCPPSKRLRGPNQDKAEAFDDPFGDDEDFTQDDLDEIDILSSQAAITAAIPVLGSKRGTKPVELDNGSRFYQSAGQTKPLSRASANQSSENMCGFSSKGGNAGIPIREPLGEFRTELNFAER